MSQNAEALTAYKYFRGLLQQALQAEREAWFDLVQAHARKARGEGQGPTEEMVLLREERMRTATSIQREIDMLAEKHWG